MARYDENDGSWLASDNSRHYSEFDADKHSSWISSGGSNNNSSNEINRQVGSAAGSLLGPLIVFAIVAYLFYMALRQYAFYILPVIVLLLALRMGVRRKALTIVAGICALTCLYGAFIHYPYAIEPSPFTKDYVVKESTMHSWRGFGSSTGLTVGEKGQVNGMSRDRKFLNITTPADKTGWVEASAFPEDAIRPADEMWKIIKSNILPFGDRLMLHRDLWTANDKALRDRDWVSVENKVLRDYLGNKNEEKYRPKAEGLTPKAQSMTKGVNQTVAAKWNKENGVVIEELTGKECSTVDTKVTLLNVVYTPEATIIQLDCEKEARNDMTADRATALTDLETGEVFPLFTVEKTDDEQFFLIFPPTQSRHFALSQMSEETRKMLEKKNAGFVYWNFPEVKVDNLSAQKPKTAAPEPSFSAVVTVASSTLYGTEHKTYLFLLTKIKMAEVATVKKGDEVTVTGAEVEGYTPVRLNTAEEEKGWIKTSDISKERTEIKPVKVPFKVKVTKNFLLTGFTMQVYAGDVLTVVEVTNDNDYYVTYEGKKHAI